MQFINSIAEKHRLLSLPEPLHPLVSVVRISDMNYTDAIQWDKFSMGFYCISLKKNVSGKTRYGQQYYDFDKGTMTFVAPRQVLSLPYIQTESMNPASGYALLVHPDFFYKHPLAAKVRNYGFFSYTVNEALHLSEKEEKNIVDLFQKMEQEQAHIDRHTQEILLSQIDLLLNYSNRFYERQFITRKAVNHDILSRMEFLLKESFVADGLPTVDSIAEKMNLSPNYLSDVLRSLTGRSAQQHIHDQLIEKAKEYLSATTLSVSEIAYTLGFGYPQSFNKLFKKKTNISPLEFRQTFN